MRCITFFVFFFAICFRGYPQAGKVVSDDTAFISAILQQHNVYRTELQLTPLSWSNDLAKDALAWAKHLASIDKGQHDLSVRGKEGENLWWGSANAFSYSQMVAFWGGERKDFKYGVFPDCGVTRGAMIGHYTQIVWRNTNSVGCALASNGSNDYLVCRYSPAGNVVGEKPY
jgi:hypothetical protein